MEAESTHDGVNVSLTSDEVLVLFEWLAGFNKAAPEFADQAEQRVLWDLEATLESVHSAVFRGDYDELVSAARSRVRDTQE